MNKGFIAEELATILLQRMGYKVIARNYEYEINGKKVCEIDVIAEDGKYKYAVEVKSGKIGVSDVRNAYSNAEMTGLKPLIVCRGFSEESARIAASKLGVKVLSMSKYFLLLEYEDLYRVVEHAIKRILISYGLMRPVLAEEIGSEEFKVIKAIALSNDMDEAVSKAKLSKKKIEKTISDLRRRRIIPEGTFGYKELKEACKSIIYHLRIQGFNEKT